MTHRIQTARDPRGLTTLDFEGLLDRGAVADLRARVQRATARGDAVRVVLRAGTQVDRDCLRELQGAGAELVAESPYLARWIADATRPARTGSPGGGEPGGDPTA